jgi:dTDP-4-dehydrorhamnose reductase
VRALVTGMNGTVAPVLAARLERAGYEAVAWDRARTPPADADAVRAFVARVAPALVVHAAMGDPAWAGTLADACAHGSIRFVFTSTVSVFSGRGGAPYRPDTVPDATDEYGRYKIECERRIARVCPDALVARIGWQIGSAPGGNNMLTYFAEANARDGEVRASERWFPACSFLEDTAEALVDLVGRGATGTFHVDGNRRLSLFEIATRLDRLHGRPWTVVPSEEPVLDYRMEDERVRVRPIEERLG